MAGVLLGPGPLTKSVAAPYDATATYGVGDHCSKDGKIYICVSAITTAEAWTAAHWERVMVEEEIEDTKKGLAYVEEGTTASQNITAGSYVWWQGQMCVAASAIAVGDTLSTTNLTIKSTGGLNDLNSKMTAVNITSLCSWASNINANYVIDLKAIRCVAIGFYVNKSAILDNATVVTLPSSYTLYETFQTSVACDANGLATIDTKGALFYAYSNVVVIRNPSYPTARVYCSMIVPYV